MNLEELIATEELCARYNVELAFIESLSESGLIEIITLEQIQYVHCDMMPEFEKLRRLHYDLEINLEGLQAVQHLLNQLGELHQMNRRLKNRLNLYE